MYSEDVLEKLVTESSFNLGCSNLRFAQSTNIFIKWKVLKFATVAQLDTRKRCS